MYNEFGCSICLSIAASKSQFGLVLVHLCFPGLVTLEFSSRSS